MAKTVTEDDLFLNIIFDHFDDHFDVNDKNRKTGIKLSQIFLVSKIYVYMLHKLYIPYLKYGI